MHIPKRYFHDRIVLLLLGINVLLTMTGVISILVRLDMGRAAGHIIEYRSQLGLGAFRSGPASAILSFIAFVLFVLVFHTILSMRVYNLRRHFAVAILGMAVLLLTLSLLVSNALLVL
ncbi:hypothetical protein BH23PAT1_BH23PAT1_4820 [soil metagenome]